MEGEHVGVGRQAVNRGRKMLYEIMYDAFYRQDAYRSAGRVNNGKMAVAAFLHAADGGADRFARLNDDRVGCHALAQRRRILPAALRQDATDQVAFGEDADETSG